MGLGPQPARDIHRQYQPAIDGAGQRHPGQRGTQPLDVDPALGHRRVRRPVTPTVLTHQRQLSQRPHRPIRAQHCIRQLEHRIRPRRQATIEVPPEPTQLPERLVPHHIMHTDHQTALGC
jgi:hypothetical protein